MNRHIESFLERDEERLLEHHCTGIPKERLMLPEPNFVDRSFVQTDRSNRVIGNLQWLYGHGRLGDTGYLSLFPVDQGVEHSAGASFSPHPDYFDPRNIVRTAIDGGCSGVASTAGVLGQVAREFSHHIPFRFFDLLRAIPGAGGRPPAMAGTGRSHAPRGQVQQAGKCEAETPAPEPHPSARLSGPAG